MQKFWCRLVEDIDWKELTFDSYYDEHMVALEFAEWADSNSGGELTNNRYSRFEVEIKNEDDQIKTFEIEWDYVIQFNATEKEDNDN